MVLLINSILVEKRTRKELHTVDAPMLQVIINRINSSEPVSLVPADTVYHVNMTFFPGNFSESRVWNP